MTRLGEILIAKGAVKNDGLRSALDACRRHGGRLGTWLVRLGLVNEATLLEALSVQSGCPAANALELAGASSEVRGLISNAFSRRHMVVAFSRQGRNLDVAMVNPNDLVLVDEIASITGMVVRPHVATEAALAAALAIPMVQPAETSAAPPPGPPTGAAREWRQFWRLDSAPAELLHALDSADLPAPRITTATFPLLAPVGAVELGAGEAAWKDFSEALAAASHRDQVATVLLTYFLDIATRVALFSMHQGRIMAWAARGGELVEEDFHTLMLPLDRPSVFLNLVHGLELHAGPLVGGEGNELLLEALGTPKPREAIIAPLRVRNKNVAFLWLDCGESPIAEIPIQLVQQACRAAGLALEILVLRQKIRTGGRLTEGAAAD